MNEIWTISINGGAYVTLASLNIIAAQRSLASLAADMLTLTVGAQADTNPIPPDAVIRLKRGAVKWFEGINYTNPRQASSAGESIQYSIAGPWRQLELTPYLQEWAIFAGTYYNRTRKPHLMLGCGLVWTPTISGTTYTEDLTATSTPTAVYITVAAAITDILAYAAANGVQIAYDVSGLPDMKIPVLEDRVMNCAPALAKILRWMPDVVAYFDYSTTLPTLRFCRRGNLPSISLPVGEQLLSKFDITERYDLLVPYVRIHYERLDQVDGATYPMEVIQTWPASASGREPGGLTGSIDLVGYQTQTSGVQRIRTEPLSVVSNYFWNQRFKSHYNGVNGTIQSIDQVACDPPLTAPHNYGRVLVEGTIYPWMNLGALATTVTCRAYVKTVDDQGQINLKYERLAVKIVATNAPDGTSEYSTTTEFMQGEEIPTATLDGLPVTLSQFLFTSLSELQYSGTLTLLEEECGDRDPNLTNLVGTCINITGSDNSAWATMRAMVQTVEEDLLLGQTVITVGPPEHLGPQDLKELQAITRSRIQYRNPNAMTGSATASGSFDLTANEDKDVGKAGCINGWETFSASVPQGGSAKINPLQDNGSSFTLQWNWNTDNPTAGMVKPAPEGAQTKSGKIFLNTNACTQAITSGAPPVTTYIFHQVNLRPLPFCMKDGTELSILALSSKPYDSTGAEHDPFETETTVGTGT